MYYRKVIKIKAEDSPNVRYAEAELKVGKKVSHKILVPGVLSYQDYMMQRETYDEIMQCVGLDAEWYVGPGLLLYPPTWLDNAAKVGDKLNPNRRPTHLGIDPAEGGDNTCIAAADRLGLIELVSRKTPNTNDIFGMCMEYITKWGLDGRNIYFDTGGGGKQHADRLRANGHNVRAVHFGESVKMEKTTAMKTLVDRKEHAEESYIYKNRRAEMCGLLSRAIDPKAEISENNKEINSQVFGLPKELLDKQTKGKKSLRYQLSKIPKLYDGEGRLILPPKSNPNPNSENKPRVKTLIERIGHSPDEMDAVVLVVYGIRGKKRNLSNIGVMRV